MHLVLYRKFAVAQSVPELDGLITGSRYDLSIISGEGDGEDVVVVAYKSAGCGSCG